VEKKFGEKRAEVAGLAPRDIRKEIPQVRKGRESLSGGKAKGEKGKFLPSSKGPSSSFKQGKRETGFPTGNLEKKTTDY